MSYTHMMLDTETADVEPESVILTLGAVMFDPNGDDRDTGASKNPELYMRFEVEEQQDFGRTIGDDTMKWWSKQSPEAREEAFGDGDDRLSLKDGLEGLDVFFKENKGKYVWSKGAAFDIVIIQNACRELGMPIPWVTWNQRCVREYYHLPFPHNEPSGGAHNALIDARRQVIGVQNITRQVNRLNELDKAQRKNK